MSSFETSFVLQEKAQEDVSKHLVSITGLLVGADTEQQSDIVLAQLSQEMYNSGLLLLLLKNMHRIDFEVDITDSCFVGPSSLLIYTECAGQEGRRPDLQQRVAAADWDENTHRGVHLHQPGDRVHSVPGV